MVFLPTVRKSRSLHSAKTSSKAPPAPSRASTSASMAPSPTPLIAPSPNRMRPCSTVNFASERFTHGGRISMPATRVASSAIASLSLAAISVVSTAAMNSAG